MLEIKDIEMNYGNDTILDNISYKFNKGTIYGLIGKNGAGKTTLLKIISRLIRSNGGSIILSGTESIDKVDYLSLPLSFIGDSPIFYPDLTVKEHLFMICKTKGFKNEAAIEKITYLIDLLKLNKYENMFPSSLSKGTLQRLNIAIGLIRDEDIVLMDEPFITLDPVQVSMVENLILNIKEQGKLFLISSHDIDSLEEICDIYLILKDGSFLNMLLAILIKMRFQN